MRDPDRRVRVIALCRSDDRCHLHRRIGRCRHRVMAFTLIESLVVLSMLAAVSLMMLPTAGAWMQRLRVDWTVQSIVAAFSYARSEAARRGAPVTVCRSGPDDNCSNRSRSCDGRQAIGTDWRCGWIVVPGHRRQLRDPQPAPAVLRRFVGTGDTAVIASNYPNGLTFRPAAGQATGSAGNMEVGSGPYARCVRIGMLGRAAVESRTCR